MRLIDADELKRYIDCGHLRSPIEKCFSELDVVQMLDKRPTIDAVPVIRCKDCDHADHDIPMSKNFVYCNMWGTISYGNGYCHHSARLTREEGA